MMGMVDLSQTGKGFEVAHYWGKNSISGKKQFRTLTEARMYAARLRKRHKASYSSEAEYLMPKQRVKKVRQPSLFDLPGF